MAAGQEFPDDQRRPAVGKDFGRAGDSTGGIPCRDSAAGRRWMPVRFSNRLIFVLQPGRRPAYRFGVEGPMERMILALLCGLFLAPSSFAVLKWTPISMRASMTSFTTGTSSLNGAPP
jgi:hypothetical protein